MDQYNFLAVLRSVIYIWAGIEFSNLTYLYFVGYKNIKTTPIIKSLQVMFFFLSIFIFVLSFLPIILELDKEVHYAVVTFLPLVIIPVAITARNFRCESLRKQTMILPDGHKKEEEKDERSSTT